MSEQERVLKELHLALARHWIYPTMWCVVALDRLLRREHMHGLAAEARHDSARYIGKLERDLKLSRP